MSAGPSTPADEAQKFAGTWKLVSLERDGVKADSQLISEVRLVFDANQFTYKGQDGKRDQGTFQLDLTHNPPSLVTKQADGVKIGKTLDTHLYVGRQGHAEILRPGKDERMSRRLYLAPRQRPRAGRVEVARRVEPVVDRRIDRPVKCATSRAATGETYSLARLFLCDSC